MHNTPDGAKPSLFSRMNLMLLTFVLGALAAFAEGDPEPSITIDTSALKTSLATGAENVVQQWLTIVTDNLPMLMLVMGLIFGFSWVMGKFFSVIKFGKR